MKKQLKSAMGPSLGVLLQLMVFIAATQNAVAEPVQPEFPFDMLDDVTTAELKETGEQTATYDPSFDSDDNLVHHFTSKEIEANRWISIDRSGVEYTATDAEVVKTLEIALQMQKNYSAVFDAYFHQQNATTHKRAVIGVDDRFPGSRRNIGYLNSGCAAFLIGPYHALTAAHCVYNCSARQWLGFGTTHLDLYVGRNCRIRGRRMRWVDAVAYPSQCNDTTNSFNIGYDIAWIKYQSDDQSPDWFGLAWRTANPTMFIEVCGYPGNRQRTYNCLYCSRCNDCRYRRESYTTTTRSGVFGWGRKTVTRYRDNEDGWQYTCDTTRGYSGSPIVASIQRSGLTWAVGVHSRGSPFAGYNVGSRITAARYATIHEWRCKNGFCPWRYSPQD